MEKINIDYMPISSINPAKYNPRSISDKELQNLTESIRKFGLVDAFVINIKSNTLVSGHQRLKVCQMLGLTEVPVVKVDLSLSEEKALNVVLNNHMAQGRYDNDILKELLKEIKLEIDDIDLGFDDLAIDLKLGFDDLIEDEDEKSDAVTRYIVEVQFPNELEMTNLYNEIQEKGYMVRIKK